MAEQLLIIRGKMITTTRHNRYWKISLTGRGRAILDWEKIQVTCQTSTEYATDCQRVCNFQASYSTDSISESCKMKLYDYFKHSVT